MISVSVNDQKGGNDHEQERYHNGSKSTGKQDMEHNR